VPGCAGIPIHASAGEEPVTTRRTVTVTIEAMVCDDLDQNDLNPCNGDTCDECGALDPFEGADDCGNCRSYTLSILEEHYERGGTRFYMPVCALA
jgi:hypothetical protein